MKKARHCTTCSTSTEQTISRCITASGSECFGWHCSGCNRWSLDSKRRQWIPKAELEANGVILEELPTAETKRQERCAKCGGRGAELHHWAPRSFFKDQADSWPVDYLCKSCHDQWHRIVTPSLIYK